MDKERMFQEMGKTTGAKQEEQENIEVTPAKAFLSDSINNLTSLALFVIQY